MLPLVVLALAFPVFSRASLVGVAPHQASLYLPITSTSPPTWKCLNDSRVIPYSAVNDDFCDCLDGTDEPGTSACSGSTFYCANIGHIGASISSYRVNDGLCESECCDGSDEPPGRCPNTCHAVGEEFRKKRDEERRVRRKGAKIRSSYIAFAQKEKKRLEDSVTLLSKEVAVREKDVARLQELLERSESISSAAMEYRKESPLYSSLITHSQALKSLQLAHKRLQEREKALGDILTNLKRDYNPNYHDMAVLEAVKGWDSLNAPPEETVEEGATASDDPDAFEGMWNADQLKRELDGLINANHESLLIEHDNHLAKENLNEPSMLFDISAYIPDKFAAKYATVREATLEWLRTLGVIKTAHSSASEETNRAQTALRDAENALSNTINKKEADEDALKKLFKVDGFGLDGEWKKLQNLCISKDSGEWTYEVCLFGTANQKGKNGGNNYLGAFSSWNPSPDVKPGDTTYYSKQVYNKGARCWNGPERSVTLHLSCGTENAILSVEEPEKCEYHLTGTTPALCLPLSLDGDHEEL